ncbi:MAG: hypothetical protein AAF492_14040, partial [Verrucomicrobiota bacterium]
AVENITYHFVNRKADNERMDHWLDILNQQVDTWKQRWTGRDGRPEARLCFLEDDEEIAIYDSRQGREKEIVISPTRRKVLDYLTKPTTVGVLDKVFGKEPGFNAQDEVDALMEQDLLFEEKGRYFSLVVS